MFSCTVRHLYAVYRGSRRRGLFNTRWSVTCSEPGNTGNTFLLSPWATCITVGSCVWECASAGSMGPCAADFISTCRKEHRQHLRLENFQHKLYSVHNEVCFKSTLFSSLPLHTHLTRITVSNLTPDPSNKAESLSLRDQHLMLLKINYFSTVDINSILEQKPFRQTEVAESSWPVTHLAAPSHPVPGRPLSTAVNKLSGPSPGFNLYHAHFFRKHASIDVTEIIVSRLDLFRVLHQQLFCVKTACSPHFYVTAFFTQRRAR